jgi:acetyl esterase/lipase
MATTDDANLLDGEALLSLEYVQGLAEFPAFTVTDESLAVIRTTLGANAVPPPPVGEVESSDHEIPGRPVVVRVHRPVGLEGALPCVYSIHGGGYVLGSYEMDDARFARWSPLLGCVGVSVEYRLAPEFPYPVPLEDCYAGLQWVHDNHAELGVDPDCIGIAGVSAGGGLAAALALLARERGGPRIAFQLLECPMVDDRQVTPSSCLEGLAVWNRHSNEYGWRAYLGDLYGTDDIPATAAPARATDLSGLPPAFVAVGGADGFRDENVDYALRLAQAGVPTELHVYPGAPHGHAIVPDASVTRQWNRDVEAWLAQQLAD